MARTCWSMLHLKCLAAFCTVALVTTQAITIQDYQLKCELIQDEGYRRDVYRDSLGYLTVGVGHLIRSSDPPDIRDLKLGDVITDKEVQRLYDKDVTIAINDCYQLFSSFGYLPLEVQRILANMSFNLGYNHLAKFKNLIAAVNRRDWCRAATQMKNSKWYSQVGNRGKRLVRRMQRFGKCSRRHPQRV